MYDFTQLTRLGFSEDEARQLRRISMTLHRWHELECGDGNEHADWHVEREGENGDGKPFMVQHNYFRGHCHTRRYRIADREAGAKRRLARIMAAHPELSSYIQGDPRGCALYILRPGDVPEGKEPDAYYSRGIPVYK